MNYIEFLQKLSDIYKNLENLHSSSPEDLEVTTKKLFEEISGPEIKNFYILHTDRIIKEKFPYFEDELKALRKEYDISFYEFSISGFACLIIFWIWNNKINLTEKEIYKLIEAILIGTFGYRIIDIQHDLNKNIQYLFYIGRYLIQIHQTLILDIFKDELTKDVMNKYIEKYSVAEFLEKKNKWVGCPFSWDNPEILGYKAAPFFYILELLAIKANRSKEFILNIEKGSIAFAAAMQMMDDTADSKTDLQNGIESLALSGFYKIYGTKKQITDSLIENFLDSERSIKIVKTTDKLFDIARDCFSENDDLIFSLGLEFYYDKFSKGVIILN